MKWTRSGMFNHWFYIPANCFYKIFIQKSRITGVIRLSPERKRLVLPDEAIILSNIPPYKNICDNFCVESIHMKTSRMNIPQHWYVKSCFSSQTDSYDFQWRHVNWQHRKYRLLANCFVRCSVVLNPWPLNLRDIHNADQLNDISRQPPLRVSELSTLWLTPDRNRKK